MKRFLLLLVLLPAIAYSQHQSKITRIDSVLTYLHQYHLFNGTVLIGEKGKVLYKKHLVLPIRKPNNRLQLPRLLTWHR
ncbi:MAG: hypothetical protein HWD62_11065 [Cyclobacteriaceae bacterium]|nr:MAG: hypothetical protein HWD62_11065 [Cyclobacteriaceae bacterium]